MALRDMLEGGEPVVAPLVFSPLMTSMAEQAGFKAAYLGGGALGYWLGITEANLSLTQIAQLTLDIKAQSSLPLIVDGTCGWGDPMHVRNAVRLVEAAGGAAIEIEDQVLPKRAHHHIGVEHIVPAELMTAKVKAAVEGRRSTEFVIIARTNAVKVMDMDEAMRRGEAFHKAGADVLLFMPRTVEQMRILGERMPHPLMLMLPAAGIGALGCSLDDIAAMGFRLVVDSGSPFFAMHKAMRAAYAAIASGTQGPVTADDVSVEERSIHQAIDLETMLALERETLDL